MRINRFVAAATGLSRRAADAAIAAGRVGLNGRPAALGQEAGPDDAVTLDGKSLRLHGRHTYIMLNKPAGYVSSRARQGQDPTLYELLPAAHLSLRIAGRLDRDSSGLVILTDDGQFVQRYTHPSAGKQKVYELDLDKAPVPDDLARLERGVELTDGLSRVKVLNAGGRTIKVAIGEGRNRQLRRTFGALGYSVRRLHRLSIGPFELGGLKEGEWREFTPEEAA